MNSPLPPAGDPREHHMLKIENLHASINGRDILKGLTLEVKPGEVHAIMGPNGAGKSTLGHVLAGREGYDVGAGSVLFDGRDLLARTSSEERRGGKEWGSKCRSWGSPEL